MTRNTPNHGPSVLAMIERDVYFALDSLLSAEIWLNKLRLESSQQCRAKRIAEEAIEDSRAILKFILNDIHEEEQANNGTVKRVGRKRNSAKSQ
ncbi:MAG: hypothetical protein NC548_32375 [Lachnospiraceae bacterium]|nr:hypothetical protein [Lachnospiraceae bacterium]